MKQTTVTIEPKNQNDNKDIFYKGNIVVNKYNGKMTLLVTSEKNLGDWFQGVILSSDLQYDVAKHDVDWSKDTFLQFEGKIILER